MTRQDQIEDLLRRLAPLFLEIARDGQRAAGELGDTPWARQHLARNASVNQVAGTARWRIVGDTIVLRQQELPPDIELSTTDEEQNQGRYYLRAPSVAIVLTIRRKPHGDNEQPKMLQLQMKEVLEQAPIDFGDEVVVYLSVPRFGKAPTFEVATRGRETLSYALTDLVDADSDTARKAPLLEHVPPARPAAVVKSTLDKTEGDKRHVSDTPS